MALARLHRVFDAIALLLLPPPASHAPTAHLVAEGSDARLARLREAHRRAEFPASFCGVAIADVELVLLDAEIAALAQREMNGGLDSESVSRLWACLSDLDKIDPLINHHRYCASYFANARALAEHIASRHIHAAT